MAPQVPPIKVIGTDKVRSWCPVRPLVIVTMNLRRTVHREVRYFYAVCYAM